MKNPRQILRATFKTVFGVCKLDLDASMKTGLPEYCLDHIRSLYIIRLRPSNDA